MYVFVLLAFLKYTLTVAQPSRWWSAAGGAHFTLMMFTLGVELIFPSLEPLFRALLTATGAVWGAISIWELMRVHKPPRRIPRYSVGSSRIHPNSSATRHPRFTGAD